VPEPSPWRPIDELDRAIGGYCWQEQRLFELTGRWAGGEGHPGIRVFFSETSFRRASFAAQWRDRLPVRAGVDVPTLIAAPAGAGPVLGRLEEAGDPLLRLGGLMTVLPGLLSTYRRHLDGAWPVNEAPVMAVLRLIEGSEDRELRRGGSLLQRELEAAGRSTEVAEFCQGLKRDVAVTPCIAPAAQPS